MIKQIKSNLTNIVVIIGLIGSIGAGFIKYGEIMTKIDVLTNASKTIDISIIAVLEEKVAVLEAKKPVNVNEIKIQAKVNEAELKILKLEIEEIKENLKNPLN